jgi:penicillin-binding protein 2
MKTTSPKIFVFALCFVALFTLLCVRLIDVQYFHGETYVKKAENNRFFTQVVPAERGKFLDRYGDALVWNTQKYYKISEPTALFETRTPLNRDDALRVMSSTESASIVTDTERQYRFPLPLSQTLGYVGNVTAEDLQRDATLDINQEVGKSGLEKTFDKQLRGVNGEAVFEVDALGQKQRKIEQTDPQAGADLRTSIDPYLSSFALSALGDQHGSVLITDAQTGEVLTLVSNPTFDPNLLSRSFAEKDKEAARREQVQQLFSDPRQLFFNRAISAVYPPGSIFKIVTALAGLENGKINESTQVVDEGQLKVGDYVYGNWYFRQYGRVEGAIGVVRALARSNDIFFYKVAEWVGPDALATMARMVSFGQKTGIELPAEARGLVPDPAWKTQVKDEKWFLGDTYHYGIGQGDLLTSPVQVAQMTQAIANHGTLCQLSLVDSASDQTQKKCRDISANQANIEMVLRGMLGVCSQGGTAFPLFPYNLKNSHPDENIQQNIDHGAIVCKTGTAEFGAANEKGYRKTHGWLTSIVGLPSFEEGTGAEATSASTASESALVVPNVSDQISGANQLHQKWRAAVGAHGFPRRVTITVMVESDDQNPYKEGSADAGPIAKNILAWMME